MTLLPKFIGSTHPAGSCVPGITWDTVLSLLVWVSKGAGVELWEELSITGSV